MPPVPDRDRENMKRGLFVGLLISPRYTAPKDLNTPVHRPVRILPISRIKTLLAKARTIHPITKGIDTMRCVNLLPYLSEKMPAPIQPNAIARHALEAEIEEKDRYVCFSFYKYVF